MNPAREVKTEKFSRTEGKTPAFDTEQLQKVLDKIDTVVSLKVEDYFQTGKRSMIRFREKGGKDEGDPGAPQTGGAS
jgi:hypothetical protein